MLQQLLTLQLYIHVVKELQFSDFWITEDDAVHQ
jgi:hypothetical protein